MSSCPVLAISDFTLPFELQCDALGEGIGAVLIQRRHPIAFESRKLTEIERHYSIYDKEMLAIMHALEKFQQHIVCGKFHVKTDHNSLHYYMNQIYLNNQQQKWMSKIQAYEFDIEYVKGTHNIVADALSRHPCLNTITSITKEWKNHIIPKYAKDYLANEILGGRIPNDEYKVNEDIILYKNRVYLLDNSRMKDNILREYHDKPLVGHQGYYKTYKQIQERYSWKGLKKDVLKHVQECMICQQNKVEQEHLASLLKPLPIPNQKWESISMDFITGLPKLYVKDCIYVIVYRNTKYTHFFAISTNYSVVQIEEVFFKEVFRLHGLPINIVSDKDNLFLRQFWQEHFSLAGTKLTPSTSYHPQTNDQTEIVTKWIEGYFRNYVTRQHKGWTKWLHLGEHCYNNTHHMSIGMSPFKALYGYEATSFGDLVQDSREYLELKTFLNRILTS